MYSEPCALSIRALPEKGNVAEEPPETDPVEITDENLLRKLRSFKGQFSYRGTPVFYYEYLWPEQFPWTRDDPEVQQRLQQLAKGSYSWPACRKNVFETK